MAMNPRVKKLWVNALRNEYADLQCRYALHSGFKFCVQGVLADLYVKEHPKAKWVRVPATENRFALREKGRDCGASNFLPDEVWDWAGLDFPLYLKCEWSGGVVTHDLMTLNDRLRVTFRAFADLIEEQL